MKNKYFLAASVALACLAAQTQNSAAAVRVYKNCSLLNNDYPGGVAKPGALNRGGKTKFQPKYDLNLYLVNSKSDRDKDGVACEK